MTNTNIEIFNSAEFGRVRIIEEDGNYLFCAKDVAEALGYAVPRKAIHDHCRYVLKRNVPHPQSESKMVQMLFVSEGDVYRLIVHSKLPSAERFERWVFDEVLPSLRKNGIYITDPLVKQFARDPDFAHAVVDALYAQTDRVVQQAMYIKDFIDPEGGVSLRVAAKQLNVPEHWFIRFLIKGRFLYRCGRYLLPYAELRNKGCFAVKEGQTLVTPKGKAMLRDLLMCQ